MKKTKMTLLSLVAMVCMIGTAFAAFTFNAGTLAQQSVGVGIEVAAATDYGEILATPTNFVVDDTLPAIQIQVKYTAVDNENYKPVGQMQLTVTPVDLTDKLADYFTLGTVNLGDWANALDVEDKDAPVSISVTWKSKPTSSAAYATMVEDLENLSFTVKIQLTFDDE